MRRILLLLTLVLTSTAAYAIDPPSGYDYCEPVMGSSTPRLVCQRTDGGIDTCIIWSGGWLCGGSSSTAGGPRTN